MEMLSVLLKEYENESTITRRFLERVPSDKFDWSPHPKSSTLKDLAVHIAELSGWVDMALNTDGLDFAATEHKPTPVEATNDLLRIFERYYLEGKRALNDAKGTDLDKKWILRHGDTILAEMNKHETIRQTMIHIAHHRAQLGVYFRLLDVPVPSTYGPSADEAVF